MILSEEWKEQYLRHLKEEYERILDERGLSQYDKESQELLCTMLEQHPTWVAKYELMDNGEYIDAVEFKKVRLTDFDLLVLKGKMTDIYN